MTTKFASYNLKDYVLVYKDFIDINYCNMVVENLESSDEWTRHSYFNNITNTHHSFEDDLWVQSYNNNPSIKVINDSLWGIVNNYVTTELPKLINNDKLFSSWSGYSNLRINKYTVGTNMKEHVDHIHSMFDGTRKGIPILTILGSLNDNYKGGELFMWDEEVKLSAGSVMIFPSNFMYPHQVKSVTEGSRYSFVSWVW